MERLKRLWLGKVRAAFQNRSILKSNSNGPAYFLLKRLDAELAKNLVAPFLEHNDDLDKIVMVIGASGQDSVKGKYTHVSSDDLDIFGGSDLMKARVEKRLEVGLTENVDVLAVYRSILTGKKHYLIDATEGDHF